MSTLDDAKTTPASPSDSSIPAVLEATDEHRPGAPLPVQVMAKEVAEWSDGPTRLTPRQVRALTVLANGFGVGDAADAAGVCRGTVYRWLSSDPAVRAIYNRWKRYSVASAQTRLLALQDAAVDVLVEEVQIKQNPKLAAMLLDKMGIMRPVPLGADHLAAAKKEIEVEQRELKAALGERAKQARWSDESLSPSDRVQEKMVEPTPTTARREQEKKAATDAPSC